MTLVQQLTPFTCSLACVESLTTDLGKRISETEILREFKAELRSQIVKVEQFGAASPELVDYILKSKGFVTKLAHQNSKDELLEFWSLFGGCIVTCIISPSEIHTYRIIEFRDESVELMDPGFFRVSAGSETCTIDQLLLWDSRFLFVSIPPSVQP